MRRETTASRHPCQRRHWPYVVVAAGLLAFGGCALVRPASSPADPTFQPGWLYEATAKDYVLEVGDVFDVKVFYHPELNDVGIVVRPDGKIATQVIGDLEVRGRTPSWLAAELTDRYAAAGFRHSSVSVLLRKSAGLRVFVGGEVNKPGMIPHDGRLTLSQAIVEAGSAKPTAARRIVLLRDSGKGPGVPPLFAVVDVDHLVQGGADPFLQPYDVIFVPPSTITKLNRFVEQYVAKMFPFSLSAGFDYIVGGSAVRAR